ncbi:hypothetical protein VTK26DRAFT_5552 [Humicola hyalothermophila]
MRVLSLYSCIHYLVHRGPLWDPKLRVAARHSLPVLAGWPRRERQPVTNLRCRILQEVLHSGMHPDDVPTSEVRPLWQEARLVVGDEELRRLPDRGWAVVGVLMQHGADPTQPGKDGDVGEFGKSPLEVAYEHEEHELANFLLSSWQ